MECAMVYINKRIMEMCEARNWSLYELAGKADVPYSSLNSSINRDTPPKVDTLERICEAFGISLAQFFIEDEQLEVLTTKEKELLAIFRKLPEEKQTALIKLLDK